MANNNRPLVFHAIPERFFEKFLKEGPFDTPTKMFNDVNSSFKSGYQIGHEITMNYENCTKERPETKNHLIEFFKVGLFNSLQRGFGIIDEKNKAK